MSQNPERDRTSTSPSPFDPAGQRKRYIVLVEDSLSDVHLIRLALAKAKVEAEIVVFEDGEKAIRFFENGAQTAAECPDLVLLDINLPRAGGKEVIRRLRLSACREVPVLVMTSSDSAGDRQDMERQGAIGYFRKPSELAEFLKLGEIVRDLLV